MHITANEWNKYRQKLAQISEKAAQLMQEYVLRYGYNVDQRMIDYAYSLANKYGEAAGELACIMYDNMVAYWLASESRKLHEKLLLEDAELQKLRNLAPAEAAETATYEETAIAVRGTAKTAPSAIPQTISRLVKQVAADTTLQNASRDRAEFAWIPSGDTCAFCRILASRGWQTQSKKAMRNGHAEHIHANCDCQYAVSFKGGMEYEKIYDPDKYLEEYYGAAEKMGGVYDWREQMNYMRRENYAKHKDLINAQKRAAYARRKEIESASE